MENNNVCETLKIVVLDDFWLKTVMRNPEILDFLDMTKKGHQKFWT